MKCCEYDSRDCLHRIPFSSEPMNGPTKLYYNMLEKLDMDKHSSLLGPFEKGRVVKSTLIVECLTGRLRAF
jgi:hypothetical protein